MPLSDAQRETLEAHKQALDFLEGVAHSSALAISSFARAVEPLEELEDQYTAGAGALYAALRDAAEKAAALENSVAISLQNFLNDLDD